MAKLCKDGFEKEFIENQKEKYGISYTQNILTGRWKALILWLLKSEKHRYGEIKKFLWNISQGSVTKQLRELEANGLVKRQVFPDVLPRVEYSLNISG